MGVELAEHLRLRSFEDASDDEACQLLEQRANQFGGGNRNSGLKKRLAKALLEVFPGHPRGFAAKARLCEDHELIVAEDTGDGGIVGSVGIEVSRLTRSALNQEQASADERIESAEMRPPLSNLVPFIFYKVALVNSSVSVNHFATSVPTILLPLPFVLISVGVVKHAKPLVTHKSDTSRGQSARESPGRSLV